MTNLTVDDGVWLPPDYPPILTSIARETAGCLKDRLPKLPHEEVYEIALSVSEYVRAQHRGTNEYIPMGVSFESAKRDEEIWAEYKGNNIDLLAAKHGITAMRVRQICTFMRAREIARRQTGLFG
jgi:Mor family transcriptional regulator